MIEGCASGKIDNGNDETGRALLGSYVRSWFRQKKKELLGGTEGRKNDPKDGFTFLIRRSPIKEVGFPGSCTGKRE